MISDEERREVAAKLREMSETESVAAMLDDNVRTGMTLMVLRAIVGKGDIFERLADLIDRPTCTTGASSSAASAACSGTCSTARTAWRSGARAEPALLPELRGGGDPPC